MKTSRICPEAEDARNQSLTTASILVCENCGTPGAQFIGGRALCLACYAERGSCCYECEPEQDPLAGPSEAGRAGRR